MSLYNFLLVRESRKKERACVRESALQLHFIPQRGATLLFELRGHLKNLPRPAHSRLGRTSLQMREAIGSEKKKNWSEDLGDIFLLQICNNHRHDDDSLPFLGLRSPDDASSSCTNMQQQRRMCSWPVPQVRVLYR